MKINKLTEQDELKDTSVLNKSTVERGIIREPIKRFAEQMELKLQKNDHKGGWNECEDSYLLHRLNEELRELQDAVLNGDYERVIDESTDVANFAMMIHDNYSV